MAMLGRTHLVGRRQGILTTARRKDLRTWTRRWEGREAHASASNNTELIAGGTELLRALRPLFSSFIPQRPFPARRCPDTDELQPLQTNWGHRVV